MHGAGHAPKGHVANVKKLFEPSRELEGPCNSFHQVMHKKLSKSCSSLEITSRNMDLKPQDNIKCLKSTELKDHELKSYLNNVTQLKKPVAAPRTFPPKNSQLEITFQEAKQVGRLESLRRQNVAEIDKEIAEMKADGFIRESVASGSDSDESDGRYSGAGPQKTHFLCKKMRLPSTATWKPLSEITEVFSSLLQPVRFEVTPKKNILPIMSQSPAGLPQTLLEPNNFTLGNIGANGKTSFHSRCFSRAISSIMEHLKITEKRYLQELIGIIPVSLLPNHLIIINFISDFVDRI